MTDRDSHRILSNMEGKRQRQRHHLLSEMMEQAAKPVSLFIPPLAERFYCIGMYGDSQDVKKLIYCSPPMQKRYLTYYVAVFLLIWEM